MPTGSPWTNGLGAGRGRGQLTGSQYTPHRAPANVSSIREMAGNYLVDYENRLVFVDYI